MKKLSNAYLSAFSMELALILRSGMPMSSGLLLLRDDDDSPDSRALLDELCKDVDAGMPLSESMERSGRFPDHMLRMVGLAERTGKMETTLFSLSTYYEQQRLLNLSIRQALTYPALLFVVFFTVVIVLITQVLPIFENVFRQLGATLSPIAQSMLSFGQALSGASTVIGVVLAVIAVIVIAVVAVPKLRSAVSAFFFSRFGGSGVWGQILRARFAAALATGIASGLDAEESIKIAAKQVEGAKKLDASVNECKDMLAIGKNLSEALGSSGLFPAMDSRMIAMGFQTGSIDQVMQEIASRTDKRARERLDGIVSAIEPTIVILTSLVAGAILLSVMLPLVGIMSGIA